jgi:hypothetical protein
LISDHRPRDVSQAREPFAEEFLGGLLVPPALYWALKHMAVLIHRTPEKVAFAIDGQRHLIQRPCPCGARTAVTELLGGYVPACSAPRPSRFLRQADVAAAVAEAQGEPYAMAAALCGEAMVPVGACSRLCVPVARLPQEAGAGKVGQ